MSYENQAYGLGKDDKDLDDHNTYSYISPAPVIVTSPATDSNKTGDVTSKLQGGQASDTALSGSGGSRRGSASIGEEVCLPRNSTCKRMNLEVNVKCICRNFHVEIKDIFVLLKYVSSYCSFPS